jgi:hypothetical protein
VNTISTSVRFIGFYTDGDNDESRGFVSVYLFLDVNNLPKGKNVTIEFALKFLNHKDPNEAVKKGNRISSLVNS